MRRLQHPDRGSASVLLAALGLGFVLLVWLSLVVSGWYASSRQADSTADIAALAAARAQQAGGSACEVAASAAGANGARVDSCRVETTDVDFVVTVTVSTPLTPPLAIPGAPTRVSARADAGPTS
ncbi:Rv3654c family TadE-like protein [Acidipropionibacterium timonense]|uniref:Rv3654c family TadE-like protein n=1 Tax=Acidipropionibacterium timonense TaxID=2161818 RepID=UPI001031141A|nr:Rv3654c family TadE-like protein [Acidipropionibacterium timonense]